MSERGFGYKFLNPYGATNHNGEDFLYPLPLPDQKWGPWIEHPEPAGPDYKDCGPGRLHVMKKLSANYAPSNWWPWFCEWEGLIGESDEKCGVRRLRLRRIDTKTFHKIIRMGYCREAYLRGAYLRGADLRGADLRGAYLREADLRGANLREADLWRADLTGADLWRADLWRADLTGADLWRADLRGANLRGAFNKDKTIGLEE